MASILKLLEISQDSTKILKHYKNNKERFALLFREYFQRLKEIPL